MNKFYLYNLKKYKLFEGIITKSLKNKKFIFLCIGNSNFSCDNFGVLIGNELKKLKYYSFGSSIREINGKNYNYIYKFLKNKFPNFKIVIIDSVYSVNSPILIFKKGGINVSGLNSNRLIGDYGILYNSFSYSNNSFKQKIIKLLKKSFIKIANFN